MAGRLRVSLEVVDPNSNITVYSGTGDGGRAEDVLPALDAFRPELVCVSAGFDAHRDDPLGGLNLLEDDYAWITRALCMLADRHAQGRLVSVLEGGYDLNALGRSAVAHVEAMR